MSIQFLTSLLQYDELSSFQEGLCAVCKNGLWGFIDNTGKEVISTQYKNVGNFCENFARTKNGSDWIFIDKNGNKQFGLEFLYCPDNFRDGLAKVELNGQKGVIDTTGKFYRLSDEFKDSEFYSGLAFVEVSKDRNGYGFIDKTGKLITHELYTNNTHNSFSSRFIGDYAIVFKENIGGRKWKIINKQGMTVFPPEGFISTLYHRYQFAFPRIISNFLILEMQYKEKIKIVDLHSNLTRDIDGLTNSDILHFVEDTLLPICRGNKWGFIDIRELRRIPFEYDMCLPFRSGLAFVQKENWKGFIDKSGEIVIDNYKYNIYKRKKIHYGAYFHNVFLSCARKIANETLKFGLIDKTGREIISPEYDEEIIINENVGKIEKNSQSGFVYLYPTSNGAVPIFCFKPFYDNDITEIIIDKTKVKINRNGQLLDNNNGYIHPEILADFNSRSPSYHQNNDNYKNDNFKSNDSKVENFQQKLNIPLSDIPLWIEIFPELEQYPVDELEKFLLQQTEIHYNDKLSKLPESIGQLQNLQKLDLSFCENLTTLPESIGQLQNLQLLWVSYCKSLTTLPESIGQLQNLQNLHLTGCENLTTPLKNIGQLQNLQALCLDNCENIITLPKSIVQLNNLRVLSLRNCKNLTMLPELIGLLSNLLALDLSSCKNLTTLPESIGQLQNLQILDLLYCKNLTTLPESIGQLQNLQKLYLSHCENLTTLPETIGQLHNLQELHLSDCKNLTTLPESISLLKNCEIHR